MTRSIITLLLAFGFSVAADAEMYKWVDEHGDVHFSDRPQHTNAGKIQLAYATGTDTRNSGGDAEPSDDDSGADESERKRAEAYFCRQATEAYEAYKNAPSVYETDENGERRYLSEKEVADLLRDTKSKISEWCR